MTFDFTKGGNCSGRRGQKQVKASTIAIHNGLEAGQEILHVHIHIIPRISGDGAGPVHSMFKNRPKISSEKLDSMLDRIKELL